MSTYSDEYGKIQKQAQAAGIDDQTLSWIIGKAGNNTQLDAPTKEKQAAYDAYQNLLKGEIARKAERGETLSDPTAYKDQLYNDAVKKMNTFDYQGKPGMSLDDARNQISSELAPLYEQAMKNIKAQQYQNELDSSESAGARGMGRSGLAQDALTKIAIASQGQMSQMEAEKTAKIAELARGLYQQDQQRAMMDRQQGFNEWMGSKNLQMENQKFNYQKGRDQASDNRWDQQFEYQKGRDQTQDSQWQQGFDWDKNKFNQQFDYQRQRDNTQDSQWKDNFEWDKSKFGQQMDYQKSRDSVTDGHWQQEFNLKKEAAASSSGGGGGGGSRGGSSGRSSSGRSSSSGSSSSSSSSKASTNSNLSGYTRDQIDWYSNPSNAPYNYGQKKENVNASYPAIQPKNDYQPITAIQKIAWGKW